MRRLAALAVATVVLCSCAGGPEGGVADKVMMDFGLKKRPEGYVSGSDRVFEQLGTVAAAEMKRMNAAEQRGTVQFQKDGEFKGKYYKEVKVYEAYFPTDAAPSSRPSEEERGYYGYIDYSYRMMQSKRCANGTEAAAETADIPTDVTGRETYRYAFNSVGDWNGGKGERVKR